MAGLMGCGDGDFGVSTLCSGDGRPMLSDDLCVCWGIVGIGAVGDFDICRVAGELGLEDPLEAVELIDILDACRG